MLIIESLEDIAKLRESSGVECKLAQGRDGKGELPKDVWETYSAFGNTHGGDIFLGLKENADGSFKLAGIENTQKVINDFWTTINNPQKSSVNIIRPQWLKVVELEGSKLIQVHVPQASRLDKPVYINGNPLTGTYQRFGSTDRLVSGEAVRRMLAEQTEDSRDSRILKGYGLEDISAESVNAYRNMFSAHKPDHPWVNLDIQQFLQQLGCWGVDREQGQEGLTAAGLLMFGEHRPILDTFPNYFLDYQEQSSDTR